MEQELLYTPIAVAAAASWLAELVPAIRTRLETLTANQRRLLFAAIAVGASVLATYASCRGWWPLAECPTEGFREYFGSIAAGLIGMFIAGHYRPRAATPTPDEA